MTPRKTPFERNIMVHPKRNSNREMAETWKRVVEKEMNSLETKLCFSDYGSDQYNVAYRDLQCAYQVMGALSQQIKEINKGE